MSRSNNVELTSPCTKFFKWRSDDKCLSYFDKTIGEKGENVKVPLPFTFLVLDVITTTGGYSDAEKAGVWSNEVKDVTKQELHVRAGRKHQFSGLYKDLKPKIEAIGGCYAQSVYIGYRNDKNELAIGNIQFSGASIGSWIDFRNKTKIYETACVIDGYKEDKKGKVSYSFPTFKSKDISESTNAQALELDKELQDYLKLYFAKNNSVPSDLPSREDNVPSANPETIDEPKVDVQISSKSDKKFTEELDDTLPF